MECDPAQTIYSGPPLEEYERYLSPPPNAGILSNLALFFRRLGHWLASLGEWNSDAKLVDHLANYVRSTRYVDKSSISRIHAAFLERMSPEEQSLEAIKVKLNFIGHAVLQKSTPAPVKLSPSYMDLTGRLSPKPPSPRNGILNFIGQIALLLIGKDPKAIASPFPIELWGVANQNSPSSIGMNIPYVAPVDICKNKENGISQSSVAIDQQGVESTLKQIEVSKEKLKSLQEQSIANLVARDLDPVILERMRVALEQAIKNVILGLDQLKAKIAKNAHLGSTWPIASYRELTSDFNAPYKALLDCLNAIEKELGIHKVIESHIQNTLLLMTKHDPQWQKLAPQDSIPDATPELLSQHLEICRKYFSDRNPQIQFTSGGNGGGTEELWFKKLLPILYPSYNPATWPLECFATINHFSWEMSNSAALPHLSLNTESSKKGQEKPAYVLGFSYTHEGHVVAFTLGNPSNGFACIDNYPIHPKQACQYYTTMKLKEEYFDRRVSINSDLTLVQEGMTPTITPFPVSPRSPRCGDAILDGGVDYEGSAIALRLSKSSSHTPILQFPEPDRWIIPKWENNNCYLAAAIVRLATFQFYYLQPSIQELIPRSLST